MEEIAEDGGHSPPPAQTRLGPGMERGGGRLLQGEEDGREEGKGSRRCDIRRRPGREECVLDAGGGEALDVGVEGVEDGGVFGGELEGFGAGVGVPEREVLHGFVLAADLVVLRGDHGELKGRIQGVGLVLDVVDGLVLEHADDDGFVLRFGFVELENVLLRDGAADDEVGGLPRRVRRGRGRARGLAHEAVALGGVAGGAGAFENERERPRIRLDHFEALGVGQLRRVHAAHRNQPRPHDDALLPCGAVLDDHRHDRLFGRLSVGRFLRRGRALRRAPL
mmetsp:Transcript_14889/g.45080  ORF Transcript_14889/g.45080 Transcript_14889/m.45080 type:complete len:280 (+) Transcript_14889:249-1088(+)